MGRYAVTGGINLPAAGVTCEKNGKFKVNDVEQTNVPHIYAIGDVIYG
jgi:pyruvate/2-oxoglutarate dehydrogenase complex dihydrolipoamide dehydrogenase (E3) component